MSYTKLTNYITINGQVEDMISFYKENLNMSKTAQKFCVNISTIRRLLIRNQIDIVDMRPMSAPNKRYNVNETYFERIDNREKAYILGLMFSDGGINSKYKQIKLKLTDIELVEKVKEKIGYTGNLHYDNEDSSVRKKNAALVICNKKMYYDIKKLGVNERKSYDCRYPTCLNGYDPDFIRGFFDGDGCISVGSHKCGRPYAEIKIVSTVGFVNDMILVLSKIGIHSSLGRDKRIKEENGIADLRIRRLRDILKFKNLIYSGIEGNLFLQKKYDKFQQVKIIRELRCL